MLTCRAFARYVTTFKGKFALDKELKSGNESWQLERFAEMDREYDYDTDEEEEVELEYARLEAQLTNRIKAEEISGFYQRLDLGWNTTSS